MPSKKTISWEEGGNRADLPKEPPWYHHQKRRANATRRKRRATQAMLILRRSIALLWGKGGIRGKGKKTTQAMVTRRGPSAAALDRRSIPLRGKTERTT